VIWHFETTLRQRRSLGAIGMKKRNSPVCLFWQAEVNPALGLQNEMTRK
jgi:hypothetical protein